MKPYRAVLTWMRPDPFTTDMGAAEDVLTVEHEIHRLDELTEIIRRGQDFAPVVLIQLTCNSLEAL